MPLLTAVGHRLEFDRIEGEPPVLVFLHEGLGCVSAWRDFPRAVCERTGRAGFVYSRPGYGKSDPVPLPRPLTFMHDEARRVLPAMLAAAEIEDAILVGHSDGASISLIYLGEGGARVIGLVAIAPHVFVEDVCVTAIAAIDRDFADPATEVREKLGRHHAHVDVAFHGWADAWLDPAFRKWDLTGLLPGVKVPVRVIQGEEDEYGTIAQVDAVCDGVAGPADRVVLTGCGHVPQRDKRDETLAAIAGFVSEVASTSDRGAAR